MTENYTNNIQERAILFDALQWHLDNGVDELLVDVPVDRTAVPDVASVIAKTLPPKAVVAKVQEDVATSQVMGAAAAISEAQALCARCDTLQALEEAVKGFEGLSIKQTAMNAVFSDGRSDADIMLIGEAPGADEDIAGKAFMGANGQLLDKILACIDLSRAGGNSQRSVYLSNVLNWRPPGNRTPTQAEMDISLPFIERHIALAQPKMLIICGGGAGKALLRRSDTISKMRGTVHQYKMGDVSIPAIVTYHPAYLLKTPSQKKAVWADMLMFQAKMEEILPL